MKLAQLSMHGFAALLMVLSWSQPTRAESRIEWVVPSGQEEAIKGLLGTFGNNAELDGGYRFSSISPKEKSIRYSLTKDEQVVGALIVQHLTKATSGDLRGKHLSVRVEPGGDPKANTHLAAAANEIIANDLEPIFKTIDVAVEPVHAEPPPPPFLSFSVEITISVRGDAPPPDMFVR